MSRSFAECLTIMAFILAFTALMIWLALSLNGRLVVHIDGVRPDEIDHVFVVARSDHLKGQYEIITRGKTTVVVRPTPLTAARTTNDVRRALQLLGED